MATDSPIVLYKYATVSRAVDIIRRGQIWFSVPTHFNDPFDCDRCYSNACCREEIVQYRASYYCKRRGETPENALARAECEVPQTRLDIDRYLESQTDTFRKSIANSGILCLTSDPCHPLMWTHNADGHRGVCLEFSAATSPAAFDFIAAAQSVAYSQRMPLVNIVRDEMVTAAKKILLTKAVYYGYEKEWRIVQFEAGGGLRKIPPDIVTRVILGWKTSAEEAAKINSACRECGSRIQIQKAVLEPEVFGVRVEGFESTDRKRGT